MSVIKRQIAIKTRITRILQGQFIKENEDIPNHVLLPDGTRISRVNIFATIVQADTSSGYPALLLDDGTGTIMARAFEQSPQLQSHTAGEIVLFIGRIREFGKERYLIPEALKKIDQAWTLVRAKELESLIVPEQTITQTSTQDMFPKHSSPSATLLKIIKSLDSGEGADEEQVIAESGMLTAEQELQKLTQQGMLFSPKPGRVKVLE
ncbi:MAG: hypothetical protein Q7K43_02085 [Candidatus Woesearchaeota archaeon]|nr:hypothetical protein [Candidatus Woesearchaeota archaeon]